jgi:LysR family transcriptional regulator, glycine cleavage system transcriptional activator
MAPGSIVQWRMDLRPLPHIDALRCFLAAAKTLNFRSASKLVSLTPAAFGHRIRQLEDALSAPLFVRTTRRVQLTRAGLALLPRAEAAVVSVARCLEHDGAFPQTAMLLGTRHELGLSWILPSLDALTAAHPWLELHMYFGSGSDVVYRVRDAGIDCAITSSLVTEPSVDTLRLHLEAYDLIAAPTLLKKLPLSKPSEFAAHTLIDIDDGTPLFRYFREAPGAPVLPSAAKLLRFGTIEAIRQRAIRGAGVAVLPSYLIAPDLRARRLVKVFPRVKLQSDHFRLVFRRDDPRRPMFELIAEFFRKRPLE